MTIDLNSSERRPTVSATELTSETTSAVRSLISATLLPGFVGTELPAWLADRLRAGLAGVCLFGPNITSVSQLVTLTDAIYAANPAAIVAIDEEGGDVTRLHHQTGSPYPGNAILGRINDRDYTAEIARRVGTDLRSVGIKLDLAPDADINSNDQNPVIGVRSFGAAAGSVATHTAAWIKGIQDVGVAACAKHFPGHGDTAQDSHLALPVIELDATQLADRELLPFHAAVAAGVKTVMTSHILLPKIDSEFPTTFSRKIINGLLREQLGFAGVVISDALDMHGASGNSSIAQAAESALIAGCDLLCIGTNTTPEQLHDIETQLLTAVSTGRLTQSRLSIAASRVRLLADQLADNRHPQIAAAQVSDIATNDVRRVLDSFDVSQKAIQWLSTHKNYSMVIVDSAANIAVGESLWGPVAAINDPVPPAAHTPEAETLTTRNYLDNIIQLNETDGLGKLNDLVSPVLVIGRNNHLHDFAIKVIDSLRSRGIDVLVVDMGWPSTDHSYADIATFGAARLVGHALLELLASSNLTAAKDAQFRDIPNRLTATQPDRAHFGHR